MCYLVRYVVTSLRYTLHAHCRGISCVSLWFSLCFEIYTVPCATRKVPSEFLAMSSILLLWVSHCRCLFNTCSGFPLPFRHLFLQACCACILFASLLCFLAHFFNHLECFSKKLPFTSPASDQCTCVLLCIAQGFSLRALPPNVFRELFLLVHGRFSLVVHYTVCSIMRFQKGSLTFPGTPLHG